MPQEKRVLIVYYNGNCVFRADYRIGSFIERQPSMLDKFLSCLSCYNECIFRTRQMPLRLTMALRR
jgi:hypothetical protein